MVGKNTKKKVKIPVVQTVPIDHVLVPKVEQATEEELKTLVEKFGITRDKLPRINGVDPAISFLNLPPGNVVKFNRKSLVTGEETPYYRLVIGA